MPIVFALLPIDQSSSDFAAAQQDILVKTARIIVDEGAFLGTNMPFPALLPSQCAELDGRAMASMVANIGDGGGGKAPIVTQNVAA